LKSGRKTEWSFKHDSTEEIESITLDPDHVFRIVTKHNVWTAAKGVIEKDLILDGYLGTYSNAQSPMKITFLEENSVLSAAILTILCSLWNQ
jgi:hypothetical protein